MSGGVLLAVLAIAVAVALYVSINGHTGGNAGSPSCVCTNGTPATGDECPADGAAACASCDADYVLENETCQAKVDPGTTCTCPHGTPATRDECPADGAVACASCDAGYVLENKTCQAKVDPGPTCSCPNGTPATGDECPADGAVACASCDRNYVKQPDGSCVPYKPPPPPVDGKGCALRDGTQTPNAFKTACIAALGDATAGGYCCGYDATKDYSGCGGSERSMTGFETAECPSFWAGGATLAACVGDPANPSAAGWSPKPPAVPAYCGSITGGGGAACPDVDVDPAGIPKEDEDVIAMYVDRLDPASTSDMVNVQTLTELFVNMARAGVTHAICAFWLSSGAADMVGMFAGTITPFATANDRAAIRKNTQSMAIMCSCFGASENPVTAPSKASTMANDGATMGKALAQFVIDNGFDGADIDFEDGGAFTQPAKDAGTYPDAGTEFLCEMTTALYDAFRSSGKKPPCGSDHFFITHAPQAPYTVAPWKYVYRVVDEKVGDKIDFYNMQMYNQMATTYMTCHTLMQDADGGLAGSPCSAVMQMATPIGNHKGIPLRRLVVGKPMMPDDAYNTGYMSQVYFAQTVAHQQQTGNRVRGVMAWQWHNKTGPPHFTPSELLPDGGTGWVQMMSRALKGEKPSDVDDPAQLCDKDEPIPDVKGLRYASQPWVADPTLRCVPSMTGTYSSREECKCAMHAGCADPKADPSYLIGGQCRPGVPGGPPAGKCEEGSTCVGQYWGKCVQDT